MPSSTPTSTRSLPLPLRRAVPDSLRLRVRREVLPVIATAGPGFTADEPLAELGNRLALPPFLEPRRVEIEAGLKPL